MVLATAANDRAAFDKLWTWTQNNLGSPRNDGLFARRWELAGRDRHQQRHRWRPVHCLGIDPRRRTVEAPPYRDQAMRTARAVRENRGRWHALGHGAQTRCERV